MGREHFAHNVADKRSVAQNSNSALYGILLPPVPHGVRAAQCAKWDVGLLHALTMAAFAYANLPPVPPWRLRYATFRRRGNIPACSRNLPAPPISQLYSVLWA